LGGLDPRYYNVVELQDYTSFDEVCVLAHKVEQQKNRKQPRRPDFPWPSPPHYEQTVNKGSSSSTPKPTASTPPIPPKKIKNQLHSNANHYIPHPKTSLKASKDVLSVKD